MPNYHVYGTRKTGLIRANFILEAITCLRENLKEIGSELLVTQDKPESFIPKLLNENFNNIIVF